MTTGHCYATRDDFWSYLGDEGADEHHGQDRLVRIFLEGASRRVDEFCRRTGAGHRMSGFGPITKVNTYDAHGQQELDLDDDLISLTKLEVRQETGSALVQWVAGTDYILQPYSGPPYRSFVQPDTGSPADMGSGYGVVLATGVWGLEDRRRPITARVGTGGWTDTAVVVVLDDPDGAICAGMTLWCGTEALYVEDASAGSATVQRGAHGTTAAAHSAAAALVAQEYDPRVVTAAAQIALRRWKTREAGLSGEYGQAGPGTVSERAREIDILRASVGELSFVEVG